LNTSTMAVSMMYILALSSALLPMFQANRVLIQRQQNIGQDDVSLVLEAQEDPKGDKDLSSTFAKMLKELDASTHKKKPNSTVSKEVKTAVEGMMKRFQTMAVDKFKKSFAKTQKSIEADVAALTKANEDSKGKKQGADTANINLATCRKAEKVKLKHYEECRSEGEWLNGTWEDACREMEESQFHEWEVDEELTKIHRCDLSVSNCTNLDELKQHVDEHFASAKTKRATYFKKVDSCKAAQEAAHQNEADCQGRLNAFLAMQAKCDKADYDTKMAMCTFGTSLQEKCDKYDAMSKLIQDVKEGKGTHNSDKDRQREWMEAETMRCRLRSYTGGGEYDEKVKTLCESTVDYKKDIGVMNYMGQQIIAQVSGKDSFTCKETQVLIKGALWNIGNESSKYVFEDAYNANITLELGDAPFDFCLPNSTDANCRGFLCPEDKQSVADAKAARCHLKKCTVYECCQ